MISAATRPPAPSPKPVIPSLVRMTTTMALPNCANGPRYRQRAGSKSDLNVGAPWVGRFHKRTGKASTEVILSLAAGVFWADVVESLNEEARAAAPAWTKWRRVRACCG